MRVCGYIKPQCVQNGARDTEGRGGKIPFPIFKPLILPQLDSRLISHLPLRHIQFYAGVFYDTGFRLYILKTHSFGSNHGVIRILYVQMVVVSMTIS